MSVTLTVTLYVPRVSGLQLKTPVLELIEAPDGNPESREKIRELLSGSVAIAVNERRTFLLIALFPIGESIGALLTGGPPVEDVELVDEVVLPDVEDVDVVPDVVELEVVEVEPDVEDVDVVPEVEVVELLEVVLDV